MKDNLAQGQGVLDKCKEAQFIVQALLPNT
jgi:hypothetical protein